ncbi:hypothetical protein WH96_06140 [Kiloniella spongiae]|uniref:Uncharacterized protein n=2 Tax=Kiloniella spongiae TaxID=1489064 RepID=A0A0H2MGY5_9PROT|nr:hypothetical protein WH96_06140 [Kiloniella spongiae]
MTKIKMLKFREGVVDWIQSLRKKYPRCKIIISSRYNHELEIIDEYLDIEFQLSQPSYCPCLMTLVQFETKDRMGTVTIWEDYFYMEYEVIDLETDTMTAERFGKVPEIDRIKFYMEMVVKKVLERGRLEMEIYPVDGEHH